MFRAAPTNLTVSAAYTGAPAWIAQDVAILVSLPKAGAETERKDSQVWQPAIQPVAERMDSQVWQPALQPRRTQEWAVAAEWTEGVW